MTGSKNFIAGRFYFPDSDLCDALPCDFSLVMQAVCMIVDSTTFQRNSFFGVTSKYELKWENKNYKLRRYIALAMPRVSVADPGKGGGGPGGSPPC